jgi:hypothetical protein
MLQGALNEIAGEFPREAGVARLRPTGKRWFLPYWEVRIPVQSREGHRQDLHVTFRGNGTCVIDLAPTWASDVNFNHTPAILADPDGYRAVTREYLVHQIAQMIGSGNDRSTWSFVVYG